MLQHTYILTNLFFGLSGFVLMAAYRDKLNTLPHLSKFIQHRLFRLYPLHLIATGFVLAVPFITYVLNLVITLVVTGTYAGDFRYPSVVISEVVGDLFLLQGFGLFDSLHLNFPAWSMSVLFYCSVLFGIVTYFNKFKIFIFLALTGIATYIVATRSSSYMGTSYDYGFFRCASSFFLGSLTWLVWKRWAPSERSEKWAVVTQSAAIIMTVAFMTNVGVDTVGSMPTPLVWSLFILAFTVDSGDFAEALTHPALKWLGDRSYSIFMTQAGLLFIGSMTAQWLSYFEASEPVSLFIGTLSVVFYTGVLLWVADWTYRNIELRIATKLSFAKLT